VSFVDNKVRPAGSTAPTCRRAPSSRLRLDHAQVNAAPLLRVNNLEVVFHHTVQVLKGLSLSVPEGASSRSSGPTARGRPHPEGHLRAAPLEDGAITDGSIHLREERIEGLLPHQIARRASSRCGRAPRLRGPDGGGEPGLRRLRPPRRRRPVRGLRAGLRLLPPAPGAAAQLGGYLSGGEQQMLAIGRALVARPRAMLLDEPRWGSRRCWWRRSSPSSGASTRRRDHDPPRRAERPHGALGGELRLHHGERQGVLDGRWSACARTATSRSSTWGAAAATPRATGR